MPKLTAETNAGVCLFPKTLPFAEFCSAACNDLVYRWSGLMAPKNAL